MDKRITDVSFRRYFFFIKKNEINNDPKKTKKAALSLLT
jgi:hypothetical protein